MYGLIFDVDGVIADTEDVNAQASIQMFDDLFGVKGVKREDFEAGIGRGAEEYVKAAAGIHNLELTDEQIAKATALRQKLFLEILAAEPLAAFEGVTELIDAALSAENFKAAIATSGTREKSEAVLKSAKIPYQKMAYINGDMVTRKKPDPQLFLLAAKELALEPKRCCVIEDAPNGIAAAKAAGCKCTAVTNTTSADNLSQADYICNSIAQINLETVAAIIQGANV
jgi:HAD superfamily hydrolase (TIGR01509 family)